jgi:hypothetical protein
VQLCSRIFFAALNPADYVPMAPYRLTYLCLRESATSARREHTLANVCVAVPL